MRSLADALHPQHGTIIVNMHCGPRPRLGENLLRQLRGLPPLTFDESSPEAVRGHPLCQKCSSAFLEHSSARGQPPCSQCWLPDYCRPPHCLC